MANTRRTSNRVRRNRLTDHTTVTNNTNGNTITAAGDEPIMTRVTQGGAMPSWGVATSCSPAAPASVAAASNEPVMTNIAQGGTTFSRGVTTSCSPAAPASVPAAGNELVMTSIAQGGASPLQGVATLCSPAAPATSFVKGGTANNVTAPDMSLTAGHADTNYNNADKSKEPINTSIAKERATSLREGATLHTPPATPVTSSATGDTTKNNEDAKTTTHDDNNDPKSTSDAADNHSDDDDNEDANSTSKNAEDYGVDANVNDVIA